ncbi:hypothetical protein M2444_004644 [Paenibacillus sp. PastF-3]|uniref:hypothetical protein n=1 Tax=Paenibacillus sp. PastF-3 TaxID=2940626 RepID=UPI0024735072|nr:hypothetical protein [Paenibacillus sp. PastF-3]MDH6372815.1 hypothetical protein [Paenibacillus sp. PastF-3]
MAVFFPAIGTRAPEAVLRLGLVGMERILKKKQREALGHLMYGIKVDAYPMAIKKIKEMSQEIGHDLLIDAFEAYGSGDKPPKWASGVREWVEACYESYLNEIKESPGQSA